MSIFWDEPLAPKKHARIRVPPTVPETGWRVPTDFPNLSAASVISLDTETKDLDLDVTGPGWGRGSGHVVGMSIAAQDRLGNRGSWYFPVRHEVGAEDNLDPRNVFGWASTVLNTPHVPKVGANLTYDIGYLGDEGVTVAGQLNDVQFAEALIDGEALVALDSVSWKYLRRGKTTDVMYPWIREAYPNTPPTKLRRDIYRTPPKLVGFYAEDDANNPIDIFQHQRPIIDRDELEYVYRLECDLIPLMIAMRREGITVDVEQATNLLNELRIEIEHMYKRVETEFGAKPQDSSSRECARVLEMHGITAPDTDAGNPSVQKEWLAGLELPVADLLNDIREHEKICGTFLQSYIINKNVGGKLFPQFHQLKNDDNGTILGRFSSSEPNLQNIPSRTLLGKRVRKCFTHDVGHYQYRKHDYSQIHYRILANVAVDKGDGSAEALRNSYRNDPKMDYHQKVYENVAPLLGWDINDKEMAKFRRRPIKNVNFGLLYGQSINSLMYKTAMYFGQGFTKADGQAFFDAYFRGAPYVKPTMRAISNEVQTFGYVKTLLGRRVRFNEWEPILKEKGEYYPPMSYESALREWGPAIKRAYEYRGVNYKFQGSEPDIMKHGMRDCWNSGVFNYTGVPRITVHDELGFSQRDNSPETNEAFEFIKRTQEQTIRLSVPVFVDTHGAQSWGECD